MALQLHTEIEFGCFTSPPLATDPRARKCSKCGEVLYPDQLCPDCYNFVEPDFEEVFV